MAFTMGITYSTIEIVDCLVSGIGLQTGRTLYERLLDVTPSGVPRIRRHCVRSEAEFWLCLGNIESECESGWKALVHIEAHADKRGLEVPNPGSSAGSIVPWNSLVDHLRAINVASDFNLGVFIAACEGIEALRPMTIKKPAPYMFLVAPTAPIPAGELETAERNFYDQILSGTDLNTAFARLPGTFKSFLAERFFAIVYARVLKKQSFGRRRIERVNSLVKMVLPDDAAPEKLHNVRGMAKHFSRPDRERFEAAQRAYLPGGVSYDFDELVEVARTGKID
ncbi:hypothetical protein [Duganella phyllosphaerae]|uniref:Uncharacterized protein n=1 Tax=Duganella phyllosphaerae TaxID=762836 RepID=A0A1E7X7R5_9BURK|nr:hypothetical protein [Duganella phyllosphaerae]OFA09051.1 hypothetical protein DUPY_02930 [Duganella phyllosphaerae]